MFSSALSWLNKAVFSLSTFLWQNIAWTLVAFLVVVLFMTVLGYEGRVRWFFGGLCRGGKWVLRWSWVGIKKLAQLFWAGVRVTSRNIKQGLGRAFRYNAWLTIACMLVGMAALNTFVPDYPLRTVAGQLLLGLLVLEVMIFGLRLVVSALRRQGR